jgi:hypothetical protein
MDDGFSHRATAGFGSAPPSVVEGQQAAANPAVSTKYAFIRHATDSS